MKELRHDYSDGLEGMSIFILGPLPPPLGGVSVHIDRVAAKLRTQGNTVWLFDSTTSLRYGRVHTLLCLYLIKLAWFMCVMRPKIVMYHTSYLSNSLKEIRLLVWLKKLLRFQLILIEHDCRHLYARTTAFKHGYAHCLSTVDQLVCIGDKTMHSYRDNHIKLPQNSTCEAAFLPPDRKRASEILDTYPVALHCFIQKHDPVVLLNAFQCVPMGEHEDLYGIKKTLLTVNELKTLYPRIGLVIMLAQVGDRVYFDHLMQDVLGKQLGGFKEHLHLSVGQRELWPLFWHVDLFVRPTMSDGCSVSVQEALWAGVPVVASDVCWRPKEVRLFKYEQSGDYAKEMTAALKQRPH